MGLLRDDELNNITLHPLCFALSHLTKVLRVDLACE